MSAIPPTRPKPATSAPSSSRPRLAVVPSDRRRRRRGAVDRLLTGPVPLDRLEAGGRRVLRAALAWSALLLVPAALVGLVLAGRALWSQRQPLVVPRHRAEALCWSLAAPPPFAPPMRVEPSAGLVPGSYPVHTPPGMALRGEMHFTDEMVLWERTSHVGDYDVTAMWLRLPGTSGGGLWLVAGWLEGHDLDVCSFRFSTDGSGMTTELLTWGNLLLSRLLTPDNFRLGTLPEVQVRAPSGAALPTFGPASKKSA